MRIAEAASKSGLSIDTIRYYERSAMLPEIQRGPDGRDVARSGTHTWANRPESPGRRRDADFALMDTYGHSASILF